MESKFKILLQAIQMMTKVRESEGKDKQEVANLYKLNFIKTMFVFTLLLLFAAGSAQKSRSLASEQKPDTVRLFIIGNSFSMNATRFLSRFAEETGKTLIIGRAEIGGSSLKRHWEYADLYETNPDNPEGWAYKGKSLRMLLEEGTWDIVTLQQRSKESCWLETYRPYTGNLYNYIKSIHPDARIVFHQTWAYRYDSKDFCWYAEKTNAGSEKEMWRKSRAAYRKVASELSMDIIPVGDAFWKVNSGPHGYKRDMTFDYANPVYPELPDQTNALQKGYIWRSTDTLSFDSHHASNTGCYLASLVWYAYLFEESPYKITYTPEPVSPDFAAYLKKVTTSVVKH